MVNANELVSCSLLMNAAVEVNQSASHWIPGQHRQQAHPKSASSVSVPEQSETKVVKCCEFMQRSSALPEIVLFCIKNEAGKQM